MFLLPVPLYDYIIFNYCCYILFVTTFILSMFLLLLLYHYIYVFTFYKDLPEGNGDSTNKMVTKTTMWW